MEEKPVPELLTEEMVRAAFEKYRGDFYQMPPMVSAIKQGGVPLYKLARQGKVVEREPRLVHVYSYAIQRIAPPDIDFSVVCSKGFYVRTYAHDIGEDARLRRASEGTAPHAFGTFLVDGAVTVEELQNVDPVDILGRILTLAGSLAHARRVIVLLRRHADLCAPSRNSRELPGPLFLAIGVFDGVHLGHQAVISTSARHAHDAGGTPVVVTFDPHPAKVLRPEKAPRLLTATQHKIALIRDLGVEHLLVITFDREFADTPPEEFVRQLVAHAKPLREICVGHEWSFGKNRAGNLALLQKLGAEARLRCGRDSSRSKSTARS